MPEQGVRLRGMQNLEPLRSAQLAPGRFVDGRHVSPLPGRIVELAGHVQPAGLDPGAHDGAHFTMERDEARIREQAIEVAHARPTGDLDEEPLAPLRSEDLFQRAAAGLHARRDHVLGSERAIPAAEAGQEVFPEAIALEGFGEDLRVPDAEAQSAPAIQVREPREPGLRREHLIEGRQPAEPLVPGQQAVQHGRATTARADHDEGAVDGHGMLRSGAGPGGRCAVSRA